MLVLVTIVIIAYFYYHVTAFLEPDWRALYSAPGHGPYTHLTRPLLAFCARGDWLARLELEHIILQDICLNQDTLIIHKEIVEQAMHCMLELRMMVWIL